MQTSQTLAHRVPDQLPPGAGSPARNDELIRLGPFSVFPSSRLLLREGCEVPIGGRAFDLLMLLLRKRGQVVAKGEIVKSVWPSTTVDDCNIRFQVKTLRRVLGAEGDLIKTVAGRGYVLAESEPQLERSHRASIDIMCRTVPFPDWLRQGTEAETGTPYVALVDDDAAIMVALTGLIRCAGFRVEAFSSTGAFLRSDQPRPPGCMVLDAWMPNQDGLDFHAKLIDAGVRIPTVFISGYADVAMSVRAIKAGAFDFLTKPVRHEDLLGSIRLAMATGVCRNEA